MKCWEISKWQQDMEVEIEKCELRSCREGAMCFCMHQHAGKHAVRRLDLPMKNPIPLFAPVTAATLPEGAANAAAAAATVDDIDMVVDLWQDLRWRGR